MNSEVTNKLAKISEIMGDGYTFVKIRFVCETWEKEAKNGNKNSAVLIDIIDKFDKLLKVICEN